ncbi:MAG: hypothetical protein KAR40_01540 [Candidatus Sabulitectum sp.]|nr:hypothetical protein [Candidatus Sabulitectum sp.]
MFFYALAYVAVVTVDAGHDVAVVDMGYGRGCSFNCVYCYRIFGRKVGRRSPESIVL